MSAAFQGRGAVVTGGGRGIGAAVAAALARDGARVVVAARTAAEIDEVAAKLRAQGAEAWAVPCDVADEHSVRELGARARETLGGVDVLINDAGASAAAPLRKITLEGWNRMIAVNATGTFLCTREFVPDMVARTFGRIVNVASIAGLQGARYVAHYSAAKHAVVGFTRSVALELAGTGVTANAVCPAYVDTPMTHQTVENVRDRTGLDASAALAAVLATTGQERLVTPDEVAAVVLETARGDASGRTVVLGGPGGGAELVNPPSLGAPRGYSHGVLAPRDGRILFVAGETGSDAPLAAGTPAFVAQFARALDKVLEVVRAAGGRPTDVARCTVYVTDLAAYHGNLAALGAVWRARFDRYYPAMALLQVQGLTEPGALVEIEATAVLGGLS